MIKITKLEEPQILKDKAVQWTQEYLGYIQRNENIPEKVKYRYRHPEIREKLLKETHEKCAYCESKFTHIEPGDIEHIKPKNRCAHPELYVTWSNLTMACEECNRIGKKDYNDDTEPLINPYLDEPDTEIRGLGPFIYSKTRKGEISIHVLQLNRPTLIERRKDKIEKLDLLRQQYESEKNENYKRILLKEIEEQIAEDKEYSFILREFCKCCELIKGK